MRKPFTKLKYIQAIVAVAIIIYVFNIGYVSDYFLAYRNQSIDQLQDRLFNESSKSIEPKYGNTNLVEGTFIRTISNISDIAVKEELEFFLFDHMFQDTSKNNYIKNGNSFDLDNEVDIANLATAVSLDKLKPKEHKNIEEDFSLTLVEKTYELQKSKISSYDKKSFLYTYYTKPREYIISTDNSIRQMAKGITNNHSHPLEKSRAIYDYIVNNIQFIQGESKQSPIDVLNSKQGNSFGISALFASLSRASNIPTRLVSGFVSYLGFYQKHVWNEIFLNEYGWVPVDAVWGQIWDKNYFGYIDNMHIPVFYGYTPILYDSTDIKLKYEQELKIISLKDTILSEQIAELGSEVIEIYDTKIIEGVLRRNIQLSEQTDIKNGINIYIMSPSSVNTDYNHMSLLDSSMSYKEFKGDTELLPESFGQIDPFTGINIYPIKIKNNQTNYLIEEKIHAVVSTVEYNLDDSVITSYNTNSAFFKTYTKSQEFIYSDNKTIIKTANSITKGISNPLQKSKSIFDYVLKNINISYSITDDEDPLSVLTNKSGNKKEFAALYTSLSRASGIPSRIVSGLTPYMGKYESHFWVEVFFNEYGWIPLDPFLSKLYDSEFFGNLTNNHIPLFYGLNEYFYTANGGDISVSIDSEFIHIPSSEKLSAEYNVSEKNYIKPIITNKKILNGIHTTTMKYKHKNPSMNVRVYSPVSESANSYYSKITRINPYDGYEVFDGDIELLTFPSILFDVNSAFNIIYMNNMTEDFEQTITENLHIELKEVKYYLDEDIITPYNKSSELYRLYTQPSEGIESNAPEIIDLAKNIIMQEENPLIKSKKIFNYVMDYLKYEEMDSEQGALFALKNKKGDCTEFSALFAALNRASGIPARYVTGYALDNDYRTTIGHAWVEIYFNEYGWVPVDVTWSQGLNREYFGHLVNKYIAVNYGFYDHIYFYKGQGSISIINDLTITP